MREIIWVIIVVLFSYVVFELYRVLRLGRRSPGGTGKRAAKQAARGAAPAKPDEYDENGEDEEDDGLFVFDARPQPLPVPGAPGANNANNASPWSEAPPGDTFQWALEIQQLRRDVAQLRGELAVQRERVDNVEATVVPLKEQLEVAVASQGISPEYNEALVFARRGLDVEVISERCGISVAEAELVRSLAKGRDG